MAAALLVGLTFLQLDNQKIYSSLQHELALSGITLEAKNVSLSPIYTGSILINEAKISSKDFQLQAPRIFIDLNLAALLTGKALPQALYVQLASIELQHTNQEIWLKMAESSKLKLKRIDISQSEIHLLQQHLTLEKVDLDIRDIGKNKNPRVELQARIGEGRLDAHGFFRLKHGKITKGFGRLKVIDVPTTFIKHQTALQTLNGSITAHLNPDKTWQSFGHIALKNNGKNAVELRGKLVGTPEQYLHIHDMILTIQDAGAIQVTGDCTSSQNCAIQSRTENLKLDPIWALSSISPKQNTQTIKGQTGAINIQSLWKNNILTNDGEIRNATIEYTLGNTPALQSVKGINLRFSNLTRHHSADWNVENITITDQSQGILTVQKAAFSNTEWKLPITLNESALLPVISNLVLNQLSIAPTITGNGGSSGSINLSGHGVLLDSAAFELDATHTFLQWYEFQKPEQVELTLNGNIKHLNAPQTLQADFSLALENASAHLKKTTGWQLSQFNADFSQLKERGVQFPYTPQGQVSGTADFSEDFSAIHAARINMNQLTIGEHVLNGNIKKKKQRWSTESLSWQYNKNIADISHDKRGNIHISASKIDTDGIQTLQTLPFSVRGSIDSKSLMLPFAILKDFSSRFESSANKIILNNVRGTLYEGSIRANSFEIEHIDNKQIYKGQLQAGGVRLKDWRWFNKQFQTILKGNLYSTLNIQASFDEEQKLSEWKGDGDLLVYNGSWLLHNHELETRKLELSFKRRDTFTSKVKLTHKDVQGHGKLIIDQQGTCSGDLNIYDKVYQFSGNWPVLEYQ